MGGDPVDGWLEGDALLAPLLSPWGDGDPDVDSDVGGVDTEGPECDGDGYGDGTGSDPGGGKASGVDTGTGAVRVGR